MSAPMTEYTPLPKTFASASEMSRFVASLSGNDAASAIDAAPFAGGRAAAETALAGIDPRSYAASRNHLDGAVTRLSPYIRHGILSLDEVRNHALACVTNAKEAEKFIQELAWRDYWQRIYLAYPDRIWADIENYKTGFDAEDYDDTLCLLYTSPSPRDRG